MKHNTVRRLCLLSVLTAITVILAIYATFRVGNQIKIALKFITVFITGAVFGPLPAGLVAAVSDILNAVLVPVGPPLPEITFVEFIYGVIFGLFFYKAKNNRTYYIRGAVCSVLQFLISITAMSFILTRVGYFPSFYTAVIIRMPAAVLTAAVHMAAICVLRKTVFALKLKEGKNLERY